MSTCSSTCQTQSHASLARPLPNNPALAPLWLLIPISGLSHGVTATVIHVFIHFTFHNLFMAEPGWITDARTADWRRGEADRGQHFSPWAVNGRQVSFEDYIQTRNHVPFLYGEGLVQFSNFILLFLFVHRYTLTCFLLVVILC